MGETMEQHIAAGECGGYCETSANLRVRIAYLEEMLEAIKEGRVLVMDDIGQTFAEALQELAKIALENPTDTV